MMREKMPLSQRAKQFLPFDAVKGLRQALRAKEFEVEAVSKGKLAEEEAKNISALLSSLEGGEIVEARYYKDGHYYYVEGVSKLLIDEGILFVGEMRLRLLDLFGLRILAKNHP